MHTLLIFLCYVYNKSFIIHFKREKSKVFNILQNSLFFTQVSLENSNASNAIINAVIIESKNIGNVKRYH